MIPDSYKNIAIGCDLLAAAQPPGTIDASTWRRLTAGLTIDEKVAHLDLLDRADVSIRPEMSVRALYHHEPGRRYRPTRRELDSGRFECPRCHVVMICRTRKARDPLYQCADCGWSIARSDIFEPAVGEEPQLQPGEYPEGIAPPPDEQEGPW